MGEPFLLPQSEIEEKIARALAPIIESEGAELVYLQIVVRPRISQMRLFIDNVVPLGPIGIERLEFFNRLIGDALDVLDMEQKLFPDRYVLEVSSPGLERPLHKRSHFEDAVGKIVAVKTSGVLHPKALSGELLKVSDSGIEVLERELGDTFVLPWQELVRANLVFVFPKQKRKKNKSKGKWKSTD